MSDKLISSLDLIKKTSISRATLNNYIKLGILPRPEVRKPLLENSRARMLGYFPENAIAVIEEIQSLKRSGETMDVIIKQLQQSRQAPVKGITGSQVRLSTFDPEDSKQKMQQLGFSFLDHQNVRIHDKGNIRDSLTYIDQNSVILCVLAAQLKKANQLRVELPAEEYFQLISQIWSALEGSFKKYKGKRGRFSPGMMICYFITTLDAQDDELVMNTIRCALEICEKMKILSGDWKRQKGWSRELHLNIGLDGGMDFFAAKNTAWGRETITSGDFVTNACDLAGFERNGAVFATKQFLNLLTLDNRKTIRYGIRNLDKNSDVFVERVFAGIKDIMSPDANLRFIDNLSLAVTQITGFHEYSL